MPDSLPLWAQIGVGALGVLLLIVVLLVGAGTKRFGTLWVFGWIYRSKEREAEEWKALYLEAIGQTHEVAKAAVEHTVFTPEEAEVALRIVREAKRLGGEQ